MVPDSPKTPSALKWFGVFCVAMIAIGLLTTLVGLGMLFCPSLFTQDMEPTQFKGILYLAIGIVILALYAVAGHLPRTPSTYVFDLVLICLGMTSCCFLPICVPLLIGWIRTETKAYFSYRD